MTFLTIVWLMRIISRSSLRRCLTAMGMSRSLSGSRRTKKPRSAWVKMANRLSKSFGSTSFIAKALRKLWLISSRALSLAVVLPPKRRPEELGERSSFDMTCDFSAVSSSSIKTAVGSPVSSSALGDGQLQIGVALVEDEHQVAEAQLIVLAEQFPSHQRPAVEHRAIAAVEVLDVELAIDEQDAGVLSADGGGVEDDVAFRMASEGDAVPFHGVDLPRFRPLEGLEYSHSEGVRVGERALPI